KMEASSLPMLTGRLSAAEIFFSRSGRKLSTSMKSGATTNRSRRTPTTIPEITSIRFMASNAIRNGRKRFIDMAGGLLEHTRHGNQAISGRGLFPELVGVGPGA